MQGKGTPKAERSARPVVRILMAMLNECITVELGGGRGYPIWFAPLAALGSLMEECGLRRGRCILVTDANVSDRWLPASLRALQGWDTHILVLPPGEATKAAASLNHIYDKVLPAGIDRRTPVIALGGGVIGDLAGFAAATMLRGLPVVQVPTSLIAQVDSAIGGKTGINHGVGKNLVGAFHQPRLVLADTSVLATLPKLEWASGLSEVVKHALIADPALASFLESQWHKVMVREPAIVASMVMQAACIKAEIVAADEREEERRELLNFGHTFGHAIERVEGYGRFTHGEAVALGMRAALALSLRYAPEFDARHAAALVSRIPVRHRLTASDDRLSQAMRYDKKVRAGTVRLVLLRALGDAFVTACRSRCDLTFAWKAVIG